MAQSVCSAGVGWGVGREEGRLLTGVKSVQACGSNWLLGEIGGGGVAVL